ncbi:MAG: S41 family peptidase [Planctomycetes bacterium]|nr:S41 family peptidase [Planctomycetota bacterium]
MKTNRHNLRVRYLLVLLLAAALPVFSGCKPDEELNGYESSSTANRDQAGESATVSAVVLDAVERIQRGDFEGAKAVLDEGRITEDQAQQVRLLLEWHDRLEAYRQTERQKAWDEQIQTLRELEAQTAAAEIPDVNTVDRAMAAILLAREYAADEQQKGELLEDPFVQRIIEWVKERAAEYEQAGQWMDAYGHGYYWLMNLYKDNPDYKDAAERMTELAAIELSLNDSSCGESAAERHEGIRPEMLLRTLSALESNYVHELDYKAMTEKALRRCELLGQVLLKNSENIAWTASAEAIESWQAGLNAIRQEVAAGEDKTMKSDHFIRIFDEILALNAVTLKIPQEVIVANFSEAALSALDPFTTLVWPWYVQDFEKSMTQQFTGIGVEISKRGGALKILSLLPDTPAYKSGLDADDEIVAINGESTAEMTIFCAVSKITGPKGTKVTLTVRRPSTGQTWDVTIVRDKIVVQPLRGWRRTENGDWDYMIDPVNRIGYVRLTAFTENSAPDLHKTLLELEEQGLNALILDLRFNSGGYLSSASEIVDLFVSEGIIVKTKPRNGLATYEIARRSGTHPNYPLVILINGASASASEIVAGALQDPLYRRAILVGERTYGKGSVQVVTPVTGGGSQLKYTVAYYHLPSDQRVKNRYEMERLGRDDWGIAPDIEVKMYNYELRTMLDLQRDNDVLFRADHEQDGPVPVRHSLETTLQSDPQLATALMVAQAQLIARGKEVAIKPPDEFKPIVVQRDSDDSQTEDQTLLVPLDSDF